MRPTSLASALTALCLMPTLAFADAAETAQDETCLACDKVSDGAAPEGASGAVLIERTLGEGEGETIVVTRGSAVRLILHAPAGTELHLHGYDLAAVSGPDALVVLSFRAEHLGRFPIEAHGAADVLGRKETVLAYIEVRPE